MDAEILGSEWFPRTEAERAALYEIYVVGTKHSNWGLLASAARSNLAHGLKAAADLLNHWARLQEKGQEAGETRFLVIELYHLRVVGPLLGAISTAAFSLEAFLRVSAELYAESSHDDASEVDEVIEKVDRLSFVNRVRKVAGYWGAEALPGDLDRRVTALVAFRNDLAHDSPVGFISGGLALRRKRGKRQIHLPELAYEGLYPVLYDHNMPLAPGHAMLAARTHDDFVSHVRGGGNTALASALDRVATRALVPIAQHLGIRGDIDQVIRDWEHRLLQWVDSVSQEEQEHFYRRLVRRLKLKAVD